MLFFRRFFKLQYECQKRKHSNAESGQKKKPKNGRILWSNIAQRNYIFLLIFKLLFSFALAKEKREFYKIGFI